MSDRVLPQSSRRQAILEALATALESHPGDRITTASLASSLGVSEAALYRHFPSKARMFEGLLDFAEENVFGRITLMLEQETRPQLRLEHLLRVVLTFAARNPGITRLLVGDILVGEAARLRQRTGQFFERIETQIRQVLREGLLTELSLKGRDAQGLASVLVSLIAGQLLLYVQSGFRRSPLAEFDSLWAEFSRGV